MKMLRKQMVKELYEHPVQLATHATSSIDFPSISKPMDRLDRVGRVSDSNQGGQDNIFLHLYQTVMAFAISEMQFYLFC
jgi:hypothetical protein